MTVETHLYVVVDTNGCPRRAYYDRQQAWDAVESTDYSDEDCDDVWPDIPLMEVDDAE